jgi:AcrR family transcriptional regulator
MDEKRVMFAIGQSQAPVRKKRDRQMAETMDRRAARTRRMLHEALMSLILRKGYEGITVQDIIDEADIGRSTFYAHYTGKEHLLRSGFQRLRTELSEAQSAVRTRTDASEGEALAFSLIMFEHASRYANVYRALVGGRGGLVAVNEIRQVLSELVQKEVPSARDGASVPRELVVQYIVSAFLTVLTWWLERKPGLPPLQVDAMFRRLVINGIGGQSTRAKSRHGRA